MWRLPKGFAGLASSEGEGLCANHTSHVPPNRAWIPNPFPAVSPETECGLEALEAAGARGGLAGSRPILGPKGIQDGGRGSEQPSLRERAPWGSRPCTQLRERPAEEIKSAPASPPAVTPPNYHGGRSRAGGPRCPCSAGGVSHGPGLGLLEEGTERNQSLPGIRGVTRREAAGGTPGGLGPVAMLIYTSFLPGPISEVTGQVKGAAACQRREDFVSYQVSGTGH